MRLSRIKLAGFKSFAEPTSVLFPDPVVGVVGPNGCGKSNVVDAIRWVLGESRASALRGDSMKDVIFNGSGNRKPSGRASVELIFDNDDGKAAGPWAQYGEIAVGRVLDGDNTATYSINGLTVRRRDVVDLFLGTGLGPRSYAIIEQGMISRIIEGRPEDMRAFLEEAAGVSKYRERRRETEARLRDTQSNLQRIADILSTLSQQLTKLQEQAQMAQRHDVLRKELQRCQQQLWACKWAKAGEGAQQHQLLVQQTSRALEELRERQEALESRYREERVALEAQREETMSLQNKVGQMSQDFVRLESALDHQRKDRQRLMQQGEEIVRRQENNQQNILRHEKDVADAESALAHAKENAAREAAVHQEWVSRLPMLRQAVSTAEEQFTAEAKNKTQLEQQYHVASTDAEHAERSLAALSKRQQALEGERHTLTTAEDATLKDKREQKGAEEKALANIAATVRHMRAEQTSAEEVLARHQQELSQARNLLTQAQARHQALNQMQERLQAPGDLTVWLQEHGLTGAAPLWRYLQVSPGWEMALETALRDRLGALTIEPHHLHPPLLDRQPPATVTLVVPAEKAPHSSSITEPKAQTLLATEQSTELRASASAQGRWKWLSWLGLGVANKNDSGYGAPALKIDQPAQEAQAVIVQTPAPDSLQQYVHCEGPWKDLLEQWLGEFKVCEDVRDLLPQRQKLHGRWVDRQGRVLSSHSLSFYLPDEKTHGVLERQRELAALGLTLQQLESAQHEKQSVVERAQALKEEKSTARARAETAHESAQKGWQELQVELARLEQQHSHRQERISEVEKDLADLQRQLEGEKNGLAQARQSKEEIGAQLAACESQLQRAHNTLQEQRHASQASEKAEREAAQKAQGADFARRDSEQMAGRMRENLAREMKSRSEIAEMEKALKAELDSQTPESLQPELERVQAQLARLQQELNAAKQKQDTQQDNLNKYEDERQALERKKEPLQSDAAAAQLKIQAAEILQEQSLQRLAEWGGAPDQFSAADLASLKESSLQGDVQRLQKEMDSLGAVNLAAMEELNALHKTHADLQQQDGDLRQALETLTGAIASMDRDTQTQLKDTFRKINEEFSRLFPSLLGGGTASLQMEGEDILQAGIVVRAQPPGKKNSTIQLLSGGEKALTALALVFSFFQLNPAPFCVLDEVDAPLDEMNTTRFSALLQEKSRHTQFIVVTHNRMTMELCSRLVGVTMRELGVSRVVEVDVAQAIRMKDEQPH